MLVLAVAGCGDAEERSLCRVYDDYLGAKQAVDELQPVRATAGEVEAVVEDALGVVRNLGQVADSRYTAEILSLEAALEDVARTLDSIDEDAAYATWQPLIEDSVEDARRAAARVAELIEPSCQPGAQD